MWRTVVLVALALTSAGAWAQTGSFDGRWAGSFRSFGSGSIVATMAQTGDSVEGTLSLTNTDCGNFTGLRLTGRVRGDTVGFDASARCPLDGSINRLEFTEGVLSQNTINGRYTVLSNGSFYDSGTFTLSRSQNRFEVRAGRGGTVSPGDGTTVSAGSDLTFTISPTEDFEVEEVSVDGTPVGPVTRYTFSSVSANHTIAATFVERPPEPPAPDRRALPAILPLLLED